MGILARLMGVDRDGERGLPPTRGVPGAQPVDSQQQALDRYRYMLRTAPPETLEQAHAEAFSKLTSEQRQRLLAELAEAAPAAEKAATAAVSADDTQALARVATRAEVRQPGIIERTMGTGAGFGASLLSSFAMGFVGSMVAQSFFSALGGFGDGTADNSDGTDVDTADDETAFADGGDSFDDGGDFGDFEV